MDAEGPPAIEVGALHHAPLRSRDFRKRHGQRLHPERGVHVVDGLITGFHDPLASHLAMLYAIAGREVMPELLQDAFTPQRLADQLQRYLADTGERARALTALDETIALLGAGDASARAADAIMAATHPHPS